MNSLSLSLRYVRHHAASSLLSMVTFAAGVALIVSLLLVHAQLQNEFSKNLKGIDLVVGSKGSPMQLILSSVFHLDVPTGNIALKDAEKLSKHKLVKQAIPLALGDNFQGFRIVGTTHSYVQLYQAQLQSGDYWKDEMQAVIGAEVARKTALKPGDTFSGSHGLSEGGQAHDHAPYKVVGVLAATGTVLDRLVLTGLESVWHLHEHEGEKKHAHDHDDDREITALLISYSTPLAAANLPRLVNAQSSMQAASPAFEMARLTRLIGISSDMLTVIGAFLMLLAGLGVFAGLYNAMNERRYDLALLRSLGAGKAKLAGLVLGESLLISVAGVVAGIASGHALVALLARWLADDKHVHISASVWLPEEFGVVLAGLLIGVIAAIIPAISIYRLDIFKTLVRR